jgi:hypothetical protein
MRNGYSISLFLLFFIFFSCSNSQQKNENEITGTEENTTLSVAENIGKSPSYEVAIFEVKNETNENTGWGYDIIVDNVKTIHQPSIPAISGIHAFKTKEDALKTGTFAADKMRKNGSLPTLSIKELDSLGVLPQNSQ